MLLLNLLWMRFLLSFPLKRNSHHSCNRYWNKLLAFKWFLYELWREKEWSEVMFIWWFFSIKSIRYLLQFSFLIPSFKKCVSLFQLHWRGCPFFNYRYHYGNIVLIFFCFFPQKCIISFFAFAHFLIIL